MYRKILVLVDNRTVTQSAIDQAIALAQVHRADILFLCVVSPLEFPATHMLSLAEAPADAFRAKAEVEASRLLSSASAWAQRCGVRNRQATSFSVDGAHAAADTAVKRHCDLIVVGIEEQNAMVRLLGGSIVPGLISAATVPVLVCRERPICTQHESSFKSPFSSNPLIFRETGSRKDNEPND